MTERDPSGIRPEGQTLPFPGRDSQRMLRRIFVAAPRVALLALLCACQNPASLVPSTLALTDLPRPGKPRSYQTEVEAEITALACSAPPEGAKIPGSSTAVRISSGRRVR